jgi:hypothetical protein
MHICSRPSVRMFEFVGFCLLKAYSFIIQVLQGCGGPVRRDQWRSRRDRG